MENPPALLPTENYEAIEAAVMETARGRWFLAEYARRNRQADTRAILDAIDELSRQVDNHPVGSGELELLRRINALAGFATRSRAALTIEVQGRETPLLRVALSMLAEIERKLQVLGGQEAEAEADFLSASEPTPGRAVSRPSPDDAVEDELFAEPPAAPAAVEARPDVDAVPAPALAPEASAISEPNALLEDEPATVSTVELDASSEADSDLFLAEAEAPVSTDVLASTDALEDWPQDTASVAKADDLTPNIEAEAGLSAAGTQAEMDALAAAIEAELPADEPEPFEEISAEASEAEAREKAAEPLRQPEASGDADDSFTSPSIARTIQEIDGEPRWVFARKPAAVPRIAEIDALSFEEKSVYFA